MGRFGLTKWLKRIMAGRGRLVARDDRFHRLVAPGTPVERVAGGFRFTEGPLYRVAESLLLFSDIPGDCIYALGRGGTVAKWRSPSHNSNGLAADGEGRLLACEHGTRRVTRTGADGAVEVLADRYRGKRLNSPNDLVVKSDGAVCFTDPPYGIRPEEQEQPMQGLFRIPPEGGEPELLADDFVRPNGLAFSPDESVLYVDDSAPDRRHVRLFAVAADGSLSGGRIFADLNRAGDAKGTTDGMKVDREGNIYCTGPGGVWLFTPEGDHLGTVVLPEQPSNCAWGDGDLRTLYVTAETSVYRVRALVGGAPGPAGEGAAP